MIASVLVVVACLAVLGGLAWYAWRTTPPGDPFKPPFKPRATLVDGRTGAVLEVLEWESPDAVSIVEVGQVLAWHRKRGHHPRIVLERRQGVPEVLGRHDRRTAEAVARRVGASGSGP